MNDKPVRVSIRILDKDYTVSCAEDERAALMESAKVLEAKMRETRDRGKVLGTERIAVMTALNIVHDLLQQEHEHEAQADSVRRVVKRLEEKIGAVLGRRIAEDAID